MSYRIIVAEPATRDTDQIMKSTSLNFGLNAKNNYIQLLKSGYGFLSIDPYMIGSRAADHIYQGLRVLPLRNISQRKLIQRIKNPRHVIFYLITGNDSIQIVRILHERMDFKSHLKL